MTCLIVGLLMVLVGVSAHRRCGNLACSHALSIAQFKEDFTSPNGSPFPRGTTVTVFSKDDNEWETEVRVHACVLNACSHTAPAQWGAVPLPAQRRRGADSVCRGSAL